MAVFQTLKTLLFRTPYPLLAALLLAAMLVKSGVWFIPSIAEHAKFARDPFFLTSAADNYFAFNWVSIALANALGATSVTQFILLHAMFALAAWIIFVALIWQRNSGEDARKALILFLALPMSFTAFYWTGLDGVTLLLIAIFFAVVRVLPLAFFVAVLLGAQHFEQAAIGASCALLGALIARHVGFRGGVGVAPFAVMLVGVLAGRIALAIAVPSLGFGTGVGRLDFLLESAGWVFTSSAKGVWAIVFSALGAAWILLVRMLDLGRASLALVVPLSLALAIVFLTDDQTRVFAIITAPLLLNLWLLNPWALQFINKRLATAVFLVWILVPTPWVVSGYAMPGVLPHNAYMALHFGLGLFDRPTNFPTWPFRN